MDNNYQHPIAWSEDAPTLARYWDAETSRFWQTTDYDAATTVAPTVAARASTSPKSRFTAAVLQVMWPGTGRWYLGYNGTAFTMLMLWLVGIVTSFGFIGIPILVGLHVYGLVDAGLLLFSRHPHYSLDGKGRPLSD